MKENVRRIIMFCTILTLGLILIFFDVTLVQLLLMMVVIAVVLPFLLGLVTITEIRTALGRSRSKEPKKGGATKPEMKKTEPKKPGIIHRLNVMKFFEKPESADQKRPLKTEKKEAGKAPGQKGGIGAQFGSFLSSIGSLGTVLRQRKRHEKKVDDINRMLDKAVTEKVPVPAPAAPRSAGAAPGGGAGAAVPGPSGEEDPFLSLSSDEFDAGLLDDLGDINAPVASPEGPAPGEASASSSPGAELSMPSLDLPTGGEGEPGAPAPGGLEEFNGLDSAESLDSEFGELDNLSLDDVDLDGDTGGTGPVKTVTPDDTQEGKVSMTAEPVVTGETAVKTAWIPSDAPKNADLSADQVSTQSDMASFAGGASGTDEDLLSSISSDVKHVEKKDDLSLLRELKDFRAPASDIESELSDMYTKLNPANPPKEKTASPTKK
ncbi:MAG: hypothetical protein ABSB80_11920 [Methanoregula sp.]|jgi:hypothetical protein|uniref:hypothetical protein n=1 Tax=Methanoregula sp. TaxID=2052170 RepID=UPI003D145046